MTSEVENDGQNLHLQINWPLTTTFRRNLYFLVQLSQNGMHRILGYQRQKD